VHELQPRLVPEIIARCGMRWWNAEATPQVASVMRQLIIDHNIGGFGQSYDKLRQANHASELKVVQHLRAAQAHTATNHMNSASRLIAKLFRQTPALETNVNHVKKAVFGVENGGPILPVDHPVYIAMTKLVKGVSSILLHFIQILFLTPAVCWSRRLDACSFRRRALCKKIGDHHARKPF